MSEATAARSNIAVVQIFDDVSSTRTETFKAILEGCNYIARVMGSIVNDDIERSVPQHMIECNWIRRIADPDRNIGFHWQPSARRIDIDSDNRRALRKILGPDLERTSVLHSNFEQTNRLPACSESRKCGFVNRKIMFQFVGGITFMLYKHTAESTGHSRVSGVRKSGDRGPGHGGLTLVHIVGGTKSSVETKLAYLSILSQNLGLGAMPP